MDTEKFCHYNDSSEYFFSEFSVTLHCPMWHPSKLIHTLYGKNIEKLKILCVNVM